jgi:hypothetical protein
MHKKSALLAVIFASGMLNSQLPALGDDKSELMQTAIEAIANDTHVTQEDRAFWLLRLAYGYLYEDDKSATEARIRPGSNGLAKIVYTRRWENLLTRWSHTVSKQGSSSKFATATQAESTVSQSSIPNINIELANAAIEKALAQINKEPDCFAKLNLYYIALRLFKKTGNIEGIRNCSRVLDDAFQTCEQCQPVHQDLIVAASSVLNMMAYSLIPFEVPEMNPKDSGLPKQAKLTSFDENKFEESEKLRLRAVAMSDRLEPTNQVRRSAHRDLTLWYIELGKTEMAEKEKQVLFELVGTNDDRILYPVAVGCGNVAWWITEQRIQVFGCGMG